MGMHGDVWGMAQEEDGAVYKMICSGACEHALEA